MKAKHSISIIFETVKSFVTILLSFGCVAEANKRKASKQENRKNELQLAPCNQLDRKSVQN